MRCVLGSLLGIPPNFLFAQQIEIIMIADLIVCRGGIWYFGKCKALKPKRGAFFSRVPIHFKVGNGTIDLGGHRAT